MIGSIAPWQWLLDSMGAILAWLYALVGNYGIAIILLTVVLKVILFPLAWKQIKNMQHMQAIQPKIKDLQKKYKNNKPKQQEETMKLYREAGVNPLGGCLPMLLLYPFLIAMYQILLSPAIQATPEQPGVYQLAFDKAHIPEDSELMQDILAHENLDFLWMNMQCTPVNAGTQVVLKDTDGNELPEGAKLLGEPDTPDGVGQPLPYDAETQSTLDCGSSRFPSAIPYFVTLVLMAGSGFYMQRQTMRHTPAGAQSSQQMAILKYMPVLFGVFGLNFPAGLLVYWSASNLFQVGQQDVMFRMGHIGPEAVERRIAEQRERSTSKPARPSMMDRLAAKAEEAQKARDQKAAKGGAKQGGKSGGGKGQGPGSSAKKSTSPKPRTQQPPRRKGAAPGNELKPKDTGGTDGRAT